MIKRCSQSLRKLKCCMAKWNYADNVTIRDAKHRNHGQTPTVSLDLEPFVCVYILSTSHVSRVLKLYRLNSVATMAHNSVEKKNVSIHEADGPSRDNDAVLADRSDNHSRDDQALDFLKQHKNVKAVSLSRQSSYTRALRRRVDFRVIPFLCCCYTLNFLDKVLLNVRNFESGRGSDLID